MKNDKGDSSSQNALSPEAAALIFEVRQLLLSGVMSAEFKQAVLKKFPTLMQAVNTEGIS